jgi:hypothetical protein
VLADVVVVEVTGMAPAEFVEIVDMAIVNTDKD